MTKKRKMKRMGRKLEKHVTKINNSLLLWYKVKSPAVIVRNFILIYLAKYAPALKLKNFLYRLAGAKIGKNVGFGVGATIDFFFPEMIEIGENTIIGYNTVILAHEFLNKEWRKGMVKIGKNVMIGANCTILAGVEIGDESVISTFSLVNKNVLSNEFVGGVPIKRLKRK